MPELNRWLQIVEMADSFKFRLCASMTIDFVGCYIVEVVCKYLFADLEPKPMVTRGRERREARRRVQAEEQAMVDAENEIKKVAEAAEKEMQAYRALKGVNGTNGATNTDELKTSVSAVSSVSRAGVERRKGHGKPKHS